MENKTKSYQFAVGFISSGMLLVLKTFVLFLVLNLFNVSTGANIPAVQVFTVSLVVYTVYLFFVRKD